MPDHPELSGGYWDGSGEDARRHRALDVLEAFRGYRTADADMRRRTRESMSMPENDLLVLRHVLRAQREERRASPSELAKTLQISTASTTAIIDRLEGAGYVRRVQHQTDRRKIYVEPTADAGTAVRRTLGGMHQRMVAAVADLSPQEAALVIQTLTRLREAVETDEQAPTRG